VPVKRHTNKQQNSSRHKTHIFYLAKQDLTAVRVCKQMFYNVLELTNVSVGRALNRQLIRNSARNMVSMPIAAGNNKSKEDTDRVREHIRSFLCYSSHYCKKDNQDIKYLAQQLNLAIMYRMYTDDCHQRHLKAVSETLHRHVLHEDFNLSSNSLLRN